MKTQQFNKDKKEVYSTSGFKDTLASPIFYPVVVVALVLGITSMLDFVQNPLKLKMMVNVIHQKVAPSNLVNNSLSNKRYNMSADIKTSSTEVTSYSFSKFDATPYSEEKIIEKAPINNNFERVSFNYDITSENFWTNLDATNIETTDEELKRKQREAVTIGAPLELDLLESSPMELNTKEYSIYALSTSIKI